MRGWAFKVKRLHYLNGIGIIRNMTEKIHIIGASFAAIACAEQLVTLKPEAEIILIDKESKSNYLPNGLNYYLRQSITDLSQSLWDSPILHGHKQVDRLQGEVIEINSQEKSLSLKLADGSICQEAYETLVCAMGAKAESHYIKGADNEKVLTTKYFTNSRDALDKIDDSQAILVIGAGPIGIDLAYSLSLKGKSVTLIEAADHVDFHQTDIEMLDPLLTEMANMGICLLTQTRIKAIEETPQGLSLVTDKGEVISGDLAFLAVNFRPNSDLLDSQVECLLDKTVKVDEHFKTSNPSIYAIGDLVSSQFSPLGIPYYTPLINQAVRSGQALAYHLAGYNVPMLESTKVVGGHHFGYYRSSVGITEEEASIYSDLVTFVYQAELEEDSSIFRIKLIVSQCDGRLLGAQCLSKVNHLLLTNQLSQAVSQKLCDYQLAFQDFIFLKGESELAYHLHQACLEVFEKRNRHEN